MENQSNLPRITVNFASMLQHGGVIVNTVLYPELLDVLKQGMRVLFYEEKEMEVEAVIAVETTSWGQDFWYGDCDWSTVRYL